MSNIYEVRARRVEAFHVTQELNDTRESNPNWVNEAMDKEPSKIGAIYKSSGNGLWRVIAHSSVVTIKIPGYLINENNSISVLSEEAFNKNFKKVGE